MCNKESQIYVLHQNDKMIIRKFNDDNEPYYMQSHDYVENLVNDTNLYYSKIPITKNNSKFYITEINDQIENVHKKITDLKNDYKQIELNQVDDKIANLKASLKYLHMIWQNANVGNIKGLYDIKLQLNSFIGFDLNNHKLLSQALSTLSQQISQLIEIINYLVNFINALTVTHLKIFEIINNAVNLMNFFYTKQNEDNDLKTKSSTMKSILIDQNQHPILIFEEYSSNSGKKSQSNIEIEKEEKEIFETILNQYYQKEEQIFEKIETDKEKTNDIEEYFMNEVKKFKTELSEILNKSQNISQTMAELNNYSEKFNNIVKKELINEEIYKDQSNSDFYWLYFLNIFKVHAPYDPSIVSQMIHSLFNFYFENIGNSPIDSLLEGLIKEIQQPNKYFYFDVLTRISIRNILVHELFESEYQKNSNECDECEEDNDPSNKYKLIKERNLGTEITTSKFVYDNKTFNFFLEVDYKSDITDAQRELRDRELEIYNSDYSKFILRYVFKISESRIIIPYFTNRTLSTIIHPNNRKNQIKLTFVDKIVIIYEIAIGLFDLYKSNNQYHGNLSSTTIYISSKNDAYIGGFSYDQNIENNFSTRTNGPFYYHSPENKDDLKSKDIIKRIFEAFGLEKNINESYYFFFTDIFNHIIQMHSKSIIDEKKMIDYRDKLFKLSTYANVKKSLPENVNQIEENNEQKFDFIIPITSLDNFIKHNKDQISNLIPTWIFILAKELLYIHSKHLYHGSLSPKSIGIYYNHETQTFIPSIILFYSFFKRIPNDQQDKIEFDHNFYKKQNKDLKQFKNILNFISQNTNNNQFIQTNQEKIQSLNSINSIVIFLYNLIIKNCSQEQNNLFYLNYSTADYSSFQITYPIMINVLYKMENVYSFQDLFFDFGSIFNAIIEFLNNTNSDSSKSIIENIPKETKSSNLTKFDDIMHLLGTINAKCSFIWNSIFKQISSSVAEESPEIIKTKGNKITICCSKVDSLKKDKKIMNLPSFRLIFKNKEREEKIWFNRFVPRKLEIIELYLNSVEFLIRKYIYMLNPTINYALYIKISNKDYSDYQDVQIKFDHIKSIVNKLGLYEVKNENGCVVICIKKLY